MLTGGFPESEAGLRSLPGIGPYTAAAIAAIAFGRPAAVVDGNVERVTSRLYEIERRCRTLNPVRELSEGWFHSTAPAILPRP